MTNVPPESGDGDVPRSPDSPGRPPNDADRGPRHGPGRSQNRQRSSRPPRIREPKSEPDALGPVTVREIELPARRLAVPYQRTFRVHDTEWVAWVSGFGSYGTGHAGLGTVQTLHFALTSQPEKPLREVLMPTGRFEDLFDEELLRLFAESRDIKLPEPGGAPQRVRRRGEGLF